MKKRSEEGKIEITSSLKFFLLIIFGITIVFSLIVVVIAELNNISSYSFGDYSKRMTIPEVIAKWDHASIIDKGSFIKNLKNDQLEFFNKLIVPAKEAHIYPGVSHTLEFEKENEFFIKDILDWLDKD